MARAARISLAVRAVAFLFAIALAALAARLWLGSPRSGAGARSAAASGDAAADDAEDGASDAADAPPLHGEHSAKDQEALREIVRGAQKQAP